MNKCGGDEIIHLHTHDKLTDISFFRTMKETKGSAPAAELTRAGRKKIQSTARGALTMTAMAILIITSILSLRGLPSEAKFGVQSGFGSLRPALGVDGDVSRMADHHLLVSDGANVRGVVAGLYLLAGVV